MPNCNGFKNPKRILKPETEIIYHANTNASTELTITRQLLQKCILARCLRNKEVWFLHIYSSKEKMLNNINFASSIYFNLHMLNLINF